MRPALSDGQLLLTRPPGRHVAAGDVVVLTTRRGDRRVKRVAAIAGDRVELEAGRLFVNQRSCDGRPRIAGAHVQAWLVPEGHVFVVGDNACESDDSRVWLEPFVPVTCISGVGLTALPGAPPLVNHRSPTCDSPP